MKIYFIRIQGTEDTGYREIVHGYDYFQFMEVLRSLKKRGIPFTTWIEEG